MANKRHLYKVWRHWQPINPWYFLAAAVAFGVIGVGALRQNNIGMLELREKVYAADKAGKGVEKSLQNLRSYVYSHMNTDLSANSNGIYPPIQLKYRYERLVKQEKARVTKANAQIYTGAQQFCEARFPAGLSGGGRIPCIENYVARNGTKEKEIPEALYKFDFVSPRWSPDLAGWSLVASGLFSILFIIRWLSERWMRNQLDN